MFSITFNSSFQDTCGYPVFPRDLPDFQFLILGYTRKLRHSTSTLTLSIPHFRILNGGVTNSSTHSLSIPHFRILLTDVGVVRQYYTAFNSSFQDTIEGELFENLYTPSFNSSFQDTSQKASLCGHGELSFNSSFQDTRGARRGTEEERSFQFLILGYNGAQACRASQLVNFQFLILGYPGRRRCQWWEFDGSFNSSFQDTYTSAMRAVSSWIAFNSSFQDTTSTVQHKK